MSMDNGYTIEAIAHSGNVRPWRAYVRLNGQLIGYTGFCTTQSAARRAGQAIVDAHKTKK